MPTSRSVLLLGATGLVGLECLRLLQSEEAFDRIVVLTRRPMDPSLLGPTVEHHVVNFGHLTGVARYFAVNQIICALGTTMKQAGSRRNFRKVDLVYPLTAAHLGLEKKASHFLVVTAMNADARSPVFYNRIKGELEKQLMTLPYRSLTIARPSILRGPRERPRTFERIAAGLSFLTPAKYRAIAGADVAQALVHLALRDEPGQQIVESAELKRLAQESRDWSSALNEQSITEELPVSVA